MRQNPILLLALEWVQDQADKRSLHWVTLAGSFCFVVQQAVFSRMIKPQVAYQRLPKVRTSRLRVTSTSHLYWVGISHKASSHSQARAVSASGLFERNAHQLSTFQIQ